MANGRFWLTVRGLAAIASITDERLSEMEEKMRNTCPNCGRPAVGFLRKSFGRGTFACQSCGTKLTLPLWRYALLVPAVLVVVVVNFPANLIIALVLTSILFGIWTFLPLQRVG